MTSLAHSDPESLRENGKQSKWRRLRYLLDTSFPNRADEERFTHESWQRNKWLIHAFSVAALLHTIYVNLIYSVVYESSVFRNIVIYAFLYPISIGVVMLSFLQPLRRRPVLGLWYVLLSVQGVMMTIQSSLKTILCATGSERDQTCDPDFRPLLEVQWVYAVIGPLLALTVMRNYWPVQIVACLVMFVFIAWAVIAEQRGSIGLWSQIVFTIGVVALAILIVIRRDSDERAIYIKETSNERLQLHLREEMEEKTQAQRRANEEEAKRNQFTSYIFHEVRNPLNTIILSMELLDTDEDFKSCITDSVTENFARMKTAMTSIESIINDTLDLRKMNEGKLSLNPRPFDFKRMIKTSMWTMESMWLEKQINFTLQLDPGFTYLRQVVGDETRLHQVLANYLSNAVKFTPAGGSIVLNVRIDTKTEKEVTITVTVSDTGIGISKENQKKLFQPFVQIDPERNQGGKGTGLGLSICAGIIQSMAGKYGVYSEGPGSSFFFTVTFPISDEETEETTASDVSMVKKGSSQRTSPIVPVDRAFRLSILVTDDDGVQRRIMSQLLTRLGHEVDTATDGVNCLEKVALSTAQNAPYDVILIDNQMPRLIGAETIRILREAGVMTHIISLTATADADLHDTLKRLGATEILVKPSSKAAIDKALKMLPFPGKLPHDTG